MARVRHNTATARARTRQAGVQAALRHAASRSQGLGLRQQAMNQGGEGGGQQLPSGAGQAPQVPVDPYDFSADPILQRVQALGARRTAEAQAAALQARKQLAIDSGDESLAPDEETRLAAHNNPFSLAAQFRKKAHDAPMGLTADQSKQNLGYSSAGATQQSALATALLGEQAGNQASTRQAASGITQALLDAQGGIQNDITDAMGGAAQRLQDRLGDNPVGPKKPKRPKLPKAHAHAIPHHAIPHLPSGRRP